MGKQWKQWQILFSWAPITADVDCSHEIKRHMLLERKALTNPDNILKIKDITLPTKVPIVKAMLFFPRSHIPMWEFDHKEGRVLKNWCIRMWCWRRLLRVSWTARRSNPEYSLEELMLKLKLQCFGHLIWRADSWKGHWYWRRLRAGEEGDRGWDGWKASQRTWVWTDSRRWWRTGKPGVLQSMGVQSRTWLRD